MANFSGYKKLPYSCLQRRWCTWPAFVSANQEWTHGACAKIYIHNYNYTFTASDISEISLRLSRSSWIIASLGVQRGQTDRQTGRQVQDPCLAVTSDSRPSFSYLFSRLLQHCVRRPPLNYKTRTYCLFCLAQCMMALFFSTGPWSCCVVYLDSHCNSDFMSTVVAGDLPLRSQTTSNGMLRQYPRFQCSRPAPIAVSLWVPITIDDCQIIFN